MNDTFDMMDASELRRELRHAKAQVEALRQELASENLDKSRINANWKRHWQGEVIRANTAEQRCVALRRQMTDAMFAMATDVHSEALGRPACAEAVLPPHTVSPAAEAGPVRGANSDTCLVCGLPRIMCKESMAEMRLKKT